jgi:ABC-type branched-subunit amino acid transport system substrate-binding protein
VSPAWRGIIKVGIVAPFSGPTPTNGLALLQGAQLAADELNQSGGVAGYRVQLLVVDEENDRSPFDVVSDPSVMAVVGHLLPRIAPAAAAYQLAGLAWLIAEPTELPELRMQPGAGPFRLVASAAVVREVVVQYLTAQLGVSPDDATTFVASCANTARRRGQTIELGQGTLVCDDRPDDLVTDLDRLPQKSRVVCIDGCDTPDLAWWSGRLSLAYTTPLATPGQASQRWRQLSARAAVDHPSPYVALGYDGVQIVAAAIVSALRSGHLDRVAVKQALGVTDLSGVLGHYGPHGVDLATAEVREGFPGTVLGPVEATPIPIARP